MRLSTDLRARLTGEPSVVLTASEYATLQRAAAILSRARELLDPQGDESAECNIGAADAALFDVIRDIDQRDPRIELVSR